jgi:hypothetical protein
MLTLPHILVTEGDAVELMSVVRNRRDQNTHRRIAAEKAVTWCTQQIQILQKGIVDDSLMRRALFKLRVLQHELSSAIEDLSQSHRDVGIARAMIRRRGLPVPSQLSDQPPPNAIPSDSDSDGATDNSDARI